MRSRSWEVFVSIEVGSGVRRTLNVAGLWAYAVERGFFGDRGWIRARDCALITAGT